MLLQEELGVRAARLKGITDVVPVSRNGSADSDSGDEDSDVKKGVILHMHTKTVNVHTACMWT
jgi:hypothetical protein